MFEFHEHLFDRNGSYDRTGNLNQPPTTFNLEHSNPKIHIAIWNNANKPSENQNVLQNLK